MTALRTHDCFLTDDELFGNVHRLAGTPAVLIHGRYDVSGPLDTAWRLHRAWPGSRLVVGDAGHGGGGMGAEIVRALDTPGDHRQPWAGRAVTSGPALPMITRRGAGQAAV